jgi:hypothetical protein
MLPESFTMTEFLNQLDTLELPALEAPQLYADRSILKVFLYALIRQITSFKLLAKILLEKTEIRQACNLKTAPHRVTDQVVPTSRFWRFDWCSTNTVSRSG